MAYVPLDPTIDYVLGGFSGPLKRCRHIKPNGDRCEKPGMRVHDGRWCHIHEGFHKGESSHVPE